MQFQSFVSKAVPERWSLYAIAELRNRQIAFVLFMFRFGGNQVWLRNQRKMPSDQLSAALV
jgi:hypothetical protein